MSINSPLARRMPGFEARHATRRARRTRVAVALVIILAVAAILYLFLGRSSGPHSVTPPRPSTRSLSAPGVVSTLATWRLGAPISRAVVVPDAVPGSNQLIILGGATTGGLTASGVFALDVTTGALTQVGDLTTTLDDAAGAVLGGRDVVFGGASAALSPATTTVQALPGSPSSTSSGSAVPTSTTIGTLPQPRTAATALTVGTTTYIVGGEGTAGPDAAVLATGDGRHFVTVASLPVPVQFPAVAAVGDRLYVFGGVAVTGTEAGRPVNAIQVVDLKTHKVTATGHLPEPLTASAVVVLSHDVLLAGGDTTAGGAGTSTTGSTPTTMSVSTVWSFDPTSETSTPVGHLPVAVSHAGVAVLGSTAWLVGGESDGTPVPSVQSLLTAPSRSSPSH